ncbi:MAG TPA: Gfo/Idh/MocA family oxidoreductase [Gemmatimonadales bacterium]|nr:Gfo/Idh/MocA family oxidoreductase [Gemmatimonadales bacterium]
MTDTSRRDFLSAVAGAGALATFPLEEILADPRPAPRALRGPTLRPDEAIRIGIIGTGGMGTGHVESFVNMNHEGKCHVQVVALADICESRLAAAKQKAETIQGPSSVGTYKSYKELLAQPDIHAVVIAAPEHWHQQMAEDAIVAGKDVYLEKPMTLRLAQALRLMKVVQANPERILNVGTQFVMAPSYTAARDLIKQGVIGKPVWSQTSYCRNSKEGEWLYYEIDPQWQPGVNLDWVAWCGPLGKATWDPQVYARWRRYRKYSTGIIGDLLVHRITPLLWSMDLGWPVRVTASGGHYIDKAMENHDQVNLTIEFENEHTMVVAGSTANEVGLETVIRGHKGNLYVGGRNAIMRPERLFADEMEGEKTIVGEDIGDEQDAHRKRWLECIHSREAPASPVELGAKVMVIVELATRSMWDKGAFGYDPKSQKVTRL